MDRAEVLHAPRYDISGSWKNNPGENELVLSEENSTFPKNSITYVRVYLPLKMLAVTKNITLQEDKPSLRVILLSEKHQLCESPSLGAPTKMN